MPYFFAGLGKGLTEPCSPFRSDIAYGAALGDFNADGWNCLPGVLNPATLFDLSAISEYHEVCVALLNISSAIGGSTAVIFQWWKDGETSPFFEYIFSWPAASGGWLYSYSYIGWLPGEINEDGDYHVVITVTGANSYQQTINFKVVGTTVKEPEPEPPEPAPATIIEAFSGISAFFYELYLECYSSVYIPDAVADFFYQLSLIFNKLAWQFDSFFKVWDEVLVKVAEVLTFESITAYFKPYLEAAFNAWTWVASAWENVRAITASWWSETQDIVLAWVNEAKDWTTYLYGQVNFGLTSLQSQVDALIDQLPTTSEILAWFGNWWSNTLDQIIAWGALTGQQIDDLINSRLTVFAPLLESWQEIRDKTFEFFTDPIEYIWTRFTDWFLGPEE